MSYVDLGTIQLDTIDTNTCIYQSKHSKSNISIYGLVTQQYGIKVSDKIRTL